MINGRRTLSWHAVFLMTLTPILTVTAILGVFTSRGPYGGLSDTPMAVIGLAQAYPLMGLVAVAMWMGVHGPTPRRFSRLAIAAHCIPLAVLAIFWVPIIQSSIAPVAGLGDGPALTTGRRPEKGNETGSRAVAIRPGM